MKNIKFAIKRPLQDNALQNQITDRALLIGNNSDCDIVVDTNSGVAATLQFSGSDLVLRCLAEKAEVNGKKVREAKLAIGDRLVIGGEAFWIDYWRPNESHKSAEFLYQGFSKFAEAIAYEHNLHDLLKKLISMLADMLHASEAFIIKLDNSMKKEILVTAGNGEAKERFSGTIVQKVLHTGEGLLACDTMNSAEFGDAESVVDLSLVSVICVPVQLGGNIIGLVYLGSKSKGFTFSEEDFQLAKIYASIAGVIINNVEFIRRQESEIQKLTQKNAKQGFIGDSRAVKHVMRNVESLAQADIAVLLEGETGVGKGVLAHIIHKRSKRKDGPYVVVNCSSLRGELLESELYGHRRGSFTGATRDHQGLFCSADGGTILLDEIGEMSLDLQARLLRTLETGFVRPIGSVRENAVDVRVICATNRNLSEMVRKGAFREDLFFRINQFKIAIPPLRDRDNDALLLAYHFLEIYKAKYPYKEIVDFNSNAINLISSYDWPGNVRELANVIHRAVLVSQNELLEVEIENSEECIGFFEDATKKFQRKFLVSALNSTGGNKEAAAKQVGLSRSTFFRYCSNLGIERR